MAALEDALGLFGTLHLHSLDVVLWRFRRKSICKSMGDDCTIVIVNKIRTFINS